MSDGHEIDDLVERARRGDAEAFGALYDAFAPRVHRYIRFRVREASDAEDLVQRTFLQAIEALPRYEMRGVPFAAWLFRLAHNNVIDFARTRREHRPLDELAGHADSSRGPEAVAALSGDVAALGDALRTLTPDQQQVLACRYFAGLSTAETARVMGRREIAVRALQFRAIGALRRRLARQGGADGLPLPEWDA